MRYLRFIKDVILSIIMIPFVLIGLGLFIFIGIGYFIIWYVKRLKRDEKHKKSKWKKQNYQ
jgi:hypothetical protein